MRHLDKCLHSGIEEKDLDFTIRVTAYEVVNGRKNHPRTLVVDANGGDARPRIIGGNLGECSEGDIVEEELHVTHRIPAGEIAIGSKGDARAVAADRRLSSKLPSRGVG